MALIEFLDGNVSRELVGIKPAGNAPQALNFEGLDDDPQIIFKIEDALPSGWYRIELEMEASGSIQPQVFFDFGGGFSEVFSTTLKRRKGGLFSAVLKLPAPAFVIRLDPTNIACAFRLDSFRVRPLSTAGVAVALGWQGLRIMSRDPRGFVDRLPFYLQALRQPHFLQLRDNVRTGGASSYAAWMKRHDFDARRDRGEIAAAVASLEEKPLISVVMPVYNTPAKLLEEAIGSVAGQIYPNWELCIADDRSTEPHVRQILDDWQRRDSRVKVVFREENGHISHATNSAFALAGGEWIALLDHDDLLRPHALAEVAFEIGRHPDAQLIYSDEDKLDSKGKRYDPYFKPDFSRELFRSQNYLNHLTVHRAENIRAVGGWRPGFEGSQDYDLNLRIFERVDMAGIRHIPKVLYHWRAVEGSTASDGGEKSYAYTAGLRALEEHAKRLELPATVEPAPDTPFYRLKFAVPDPQPLVSLIIPTRDKLELIRNCVESIVEKTTYGNYEIVIVDNGSVEEETLAWFETLKKTKNVRVLAYRKKFNYSAINNFAVGKARGEIVGLVNNDIEVISPDWLTEMVSWAVQPDIGCVGAKLYYANDTIQHAGVILGIGGVAGHSHKYFPRDHHGYFSRLKVAQNLSAVTGACLLVRKEVYQEVGGLNANDLKVAFNDVDFCLKVREAGYRNVWTPYAELYHLESISRGAEDSPEKVLRFEGESEFMRKSWAAQLAADCFYSPNLTLSREDFSLKA